MLKVQYLLWQMLSLGHEIQWKFFEKNGGAERDRTVDPLLAKQVLSQLSYSPLSLCYQAYRRAGEWWAWIDSNYRPHPYQGCALAN